MVTAATGGHKAGSQNTHYSLYALMEASNTNRAHSKPGVPPAAVATTAADTKAHAPHNKEAVAAMALQATGRRVARAALPS